MHVDTGDSPPICQKPYTLPLKHYSWVQQEIRDPRASRHHQKGASVHGPVQFVVVSQEIRTW